MTDSSDLADDDNPSSDRGEEILVRFARKAWQLAVAASDMPEGTAERAKADAAFSLVLVSPDAWQPARGRTAMNASMSSVSARFSPGDCDPGGQAVFTSAQAAVIHAVDAFIVDEDCRLLVVYGGTGTGKSFLRQVITARHGWSRVMPTMGGSIAARTEEVWSLGGVLRWAELDPRRGCRPWERVVVLDDAGLARAEDVALLRRLHARIVALVDPNRVPPVHGAYPGFSRSDLVLPEPHPVALADPIRAQARAILAGGRAHDDGDAVRVRFADLRRCDVVLWAGGLTRRRLNQAARFARGVVPGPLGPDGGFDPVRDYPREGERVAVLRDDRDHYRGEWTSLFEQDFRPGYTGCALLLDNTDGDFWQPDHVRFLGVPSPLLERAVRVEAQSAHWSHVVVIDEMRRDDPLRPRWLYSAFCCASERVTIINRSQGARKR
jgi:hypothetical protein